MRKKCNKKTACLALAALVLTAGLTVGSTMAYFTTYATAKGGVTIDLGFTETKPREEVVEGKKIITLENTGKYDCYVRLKALTGDAYKDDLKYQCNEKWTLGADGYYYYQDIVAPGGLTSEIIVSFAFPEAEPKDFNIIIVQECTPVLHDENGTPYADWEKKADVSQSYYH